MSSHGKQKNKEHSIPAKVVDSRNLSLSISLSLCVSLSISLSLSLTRVARESWGYNTTTSHDVTVLTSRPNVMGPCHLSEDVQFYVWAHVTATTSSQPVLSYSNFCRFFYWTHRFYFLIKCTRFLFETHKIKKKYSTLLLTLVDKNK